MGAREYLKTYHPRILYIAFDETDDFAHGGMYDQYIGAAHAEDGMLADLWNTLQSIPQYKNTTTLLITTDHGRGDLNKDEWTGHGKKIKESGQIWFAVMGPDTKPSGEIKINGQLYQAQIAATIASLLGINFKTDHPVMPEIKSVLIAGK
jgi:bisphosphoglycerate-independent phosphoglycerate mutase (AlkP superfamily)